MLHFVLEAVRAEAFNPATLFLFGSYTIGKERLFLEVARILKRKVRPCSCSCICMKTAVDQIGRNDHFHTQWSARRIRDHSDHAFPQQLTTTACSLSPMSLREPFHRKMSGVSCVCFGNMQVYVSVAKRKVMEALNLPAEYRALLTTNDRAALLHAVPLWRVSLKHMARLLKHYRGRYNTIVGFQPTGWSMQTGMPLPPVMCTAESQTAGMDCPAHTIAPSLHSFAHVLFLARHLSQGLSAGSISG